MSDVTLNPADSLTDLFYDDVMYETLTLMYYDCKLEIATNLYTYLYTAGLEPS